MTVLILMLLALAAGAIWSDGLRSLAGRAYQLAVGAPAETAPKGPEEVRYYTCGMHPWVVLPDPGNCPICRMKLVPLDPSKFTGQIAINPILTQNIGVRVTPVVTGPVTRVIRTVGTVDYKEPLVRDVTLKVPGWIERLYAGATGQPVRKDEPLLEIYSPDLYAAQEEYLVAFRKKGAPPSAPPGVTRMEADLLESARKKLEYFDISDQQIADLEKAGKPAKTMTLRSPFDGLVVIKNVFEGMKVDAGTPLLRIADLSKVWIMVTVYEYQVPFVEVGQKAVMSLPYVPGQTFEGKVTYVYPTVNQELRQAKVRLEFDNPGLLLKPGMFANVELRKTLATDRTLAPREVVIDTGLRQVAFVSLGEGRFEPRQVQMGVEAEGGMVEILDGLKPGEMVVSSGEFLLDSEASLREALAKMVTGAPAAEQKVEAALAGTSELSSLPEAAAKAVAGLLDGYFAIGAKLADDTVEGLAAPARQAAASVDALLKTQVPDRPRFWQEHVEAAEVRGKALELAAVNQVEPARQKFADMGIALAKLLRATGVPPSYGKQVQELHCPMYREKQGGTIWLQQAGEVRNPYYGKAMLGCFDERHTMPVTGRRPAAAAPVAPPSPTKPGAMPPMPGM